MSQSGFPSSLCSPTEMLKPLGRLRSLICLPYLIQGGCLQLVDGSDYAGVGHHSKQNNLVSIGYLSQFGNGQMELQFLGYCPRLFWRFGWGAPEGEPGLASDALSSKWILALSTLSLLKTLGLSTSFLNPKRGLCQLFTSFSSLFCRS